jgi:hypothetical protein
MRNELCQHISELESLIYEASSLLLQFPKQEKLILDLLIYGESTITEREKIAHLFTKNGNFFVSVVLKVMLTMLYH